MRKKGKKPSDYPQFAFRVSDEIKDRLSSLVEEVTDLYNKHVPDGEYLFRKNDVIAEALERGLKQMKAKYSKSTEDKS